jgi:hypothetical protein
VRPASRRETPEQLAKRVVAKRPSPPGIPGRAELTLKLTLPRPVLEQLTVQAVHEGRRLEALVEEILEANAEGF